MIRVSVVIPTYHRAALLRRCLDALCAQSLDAQAFEIIVVDDAHSAATHSLVQQYAAGHGVAPAIRYVEPQGTRGPAGARNSGWRQARAPLIAFTDDDTIPACDWLEQGLAVMDASHAANEADGAIAAAWGHVSVPLSDDPTDYERSIHRLDGAEFVTANCFVRTQALTDVGGFDTRFTRAWREDSDLYFSLLEHGHRVIPAPSAVVLHPVRAATWGVSLRAHTNLIFDALLYKKHRRLYREKIDTQTPIRYYVMVAAALFALALLIADEPLWAATAALVWLGLTAQFCLLRLRGTARSARHVIEMIVTSLAIPFYAVFWRLAGALRYRVPFA